MGSNPTTTSTIADAKMPSSSVPTNDQILVPETLLKKRKSQEKAREERTAELEKKKKAQKEKRGVIFKRAEKYVKEYRDQEREEIRLQRLAKQEGTFYIPAEDKLVFVVRIKGINKIAPKPRKILQLLRLLQINNGVFVRMTKATLEMLKVVEPWIAYGYPNLKTVRELIYKQRIAYRQLHHRDQPRQVRHRLHGGFDPRDLHRRPQLQASRQLPLAIQAQQPNWWFPHSQVPPFC